MNKVTCVSAKLQSLRRQSIIIIKKKMNYSNIEAPNARVHEIKIFSSKKKEKKR